MAAAAIDPLGPTRVLLTSAWHARGIDPGTVRFESGTAMPQVRTSGADRPGSPVTRKQRVGTLPALLDAGTDGSSPQVRLGATLGAGGMGIVRLGEQMALGREVAVKGTRDDADAEEASWALLREARVAGRLEHPNVVPVYTLGRDERDRPLIVMKRIEGTSWGDLLHPSGGVDRSTDEYLRRHLQILVDVTMAVAFAHSRGIVHRDIKPDNVMIGAFGEVYLVDWGIAVALRPDDVPGMSLAAEVAGIEGTPEYMSPEMAAGAGELIGERTDGYLLGATLHEVLAGEPPHRADSLLGTLTRAFASEPARFDARVPEPLAAICHRAMRAMPEDRFASAAAFAGAITTYLEHHSSVRLADAAFCCLAELEAQIGADLTDPAALAQLQRLFGETRFAFHHALKTWPDNARAAEGLRRTLTAMIGVELARGAADAADALLREIGEPDPALSDEVARALGARREAEARLRQLEHDVDLSVGGKLRRVTTFVAGLVWAVTCIAGGLCNHAGIATFGQLSMAALNALFVVGLVLVTRIWHAELGTTEANRRLATQTKLVFAAYTLIWLFGRYFGMSIQATAAMHIAVGVTMWAGAALTVDRNWAPMPLALSGALGALLLLPAWDFVILGVSGIVGAAGSAVLSLRAQGREKGRLGEQ